MDIALLRLHIALLERLSAQGILLRGGRRLVGSLRLHIALRLLGIALLRLHIALRHGRAMRALGGVAALRGIAALGCNRDRLVAGRCGLHGRALGISLLRRRLGIAGRGIGRRLDAARRRRDGRALHGLVARRGAGIGIIIPGDGSRRLGSDGAGRVLVHRGGRGDIIPALDRLSLCRSSQGGSQDGDPKGGEECVAQRHGIRC
ncbi:MAG: hypothetical protein B7Z41_09285 [Rhizobiales bacterium 12-66-7]|nr:MAG: hypothetical protein B7Z41_09285 [Rhizobiales bacterium 12-66-7]